MEYENWKSKTNGHIEKKVKGKESTDELIVALDAQFASIKEIIAKVVVAAVNEKVGQTQVELDALREYKQETEKEVEDLRVFKKTAKESNLGTFLRRALA